jgi:hypothetical protein
MLIDESKGVISIYGKFGAISGQVFCDSVQLPVVNWSDNLISANIPDTGKGSAGELIVVAGGSPSKIHHISLWSGGYSTGHYEHHSFDLSYGHGMKFTIRMDLESILNDTNGITRQLGIQNYSTVGGSYLNGGHNISGELELYNVSANVPIQNTDTLYKSGFIGSAFFDSKSKTFTFSAKNIKGIIGTYMHGPKTEPYEYYVGDFVCGASVDSFYNMVPYDYETGDYFYVHDYSRIDTFEHRFLPFKTIALHYDPSIILPPDGSNRLGTDAVMLQWKAMKYIEGYHVQLSKDSLVNRQYNAQAQQSFVYIVDTIVSSTFFYLSRLEKNTKYFWRVCGVNSEGESRWSDVWSFTTGEQASVARNESDDGISIYPNPAQTETHIVFSLQAPEQAEITVSDPLGREVLHLPPIYYESGKNSITLPISRLHSGSYVCIVRAGTKTYRAKFTVSR